MNAERHCVSRSRLKTLATRPNQLSRNRPVVGLVLPTSHPRIGRPNGVNYPAGIRELQSAATDFSRMLRARG